MRSFVQARMRSLVEALIEMIRSSILGGRRPAGLAQFFINLTDERISDASVSQEMTWIGVFYK